MYAVGVFAFKCAKGLAPSYLSDCFVARCTVHYQSIGKKDFVFNDSSSRIDRRSTYFSRTFLYKAIKL